MGTINFDLPNKNVAVLNGSSGAAGVYGNASSTYYQMAVGDRAMGSFNGHTATIQLFGGTWDITVDGVLVGSGVSVGDSFTQVELITAGTDGAHTYIAAPKTVSGTFGFNAIHRTTALVVTSAGTPTLSPYTGYGPYYRIMDFPTLFTLEGTWGSTVDRDKHSDQSYTHGGAVRVKGTATAIQIVMLKDGTKVHLQGNNAAPSATVAPSNTAKFDLVSLATGLDNGSEKTWTVRSVLEGDNDALFFVGIMFVGGDIGASAPAARNPDVIYGDSIANLLNSTDRTDEGLTGEGIANAHGSVLSGIASSTTVVSGQSDARVSAVLAMNPGNLLVLYGQNDLNDGTFQTAFGAMIQKFYDGVGAQAGLRTATGANRFIILGCLRENDDATIAGKNARIQTALAGVTVPSGAPQWVYQATTSAAWPQGATSGDFVDGIHPDRQGRLKEASAMTALLTDVDTTPPTVTAAIDSTGATVTWTFSESVTGVAAADFALSGGHALSATAGSGTSWTMTITPAVTLGETITRTYTGTAVIDASSNAMVTFSAQSVTNNSTLTVPGAPVLSVDAVEAGSTGILVSPTAPASDGGSAVLTYKIYRKRIGINAAFVLAKTLAAADLASHWLDTGTADGDTVDYKVTAVNVVGEGTASATREVTSQGPHPAGWIADLSGGSGLSLGLGCSL